MDKPIWVVVANSSMARALEFNPGKPEHWTEKECLTHPQSRQQGSGAGHDLGQLLGRLDDATHKRVSASHPLDLTGLPLHELARRLYAEFGL